MNHVESLDCWTEVFCDADPSDIVSDAILAAVSDADDLVPLNIDDEFDAVLDYIVGCVMQAADEGVIDEASIDSYIDACMSMVCRKFDN